MRNWRVTHDCNAARMRYGFGNRCAGFPRRASPLFRSAKNRARSQTQNEYDRKNSRYIRTAHVLFKSNHQSSTSAGIGYSPRIRLKYCLQIVVPIVIGRPCPVKQFTQRDPPTSQFTLNAMFLRVKVKYGSESCRTACWNIASTYVYVCRRRTASDGIGGSR